MKTIIAPTDFSENSINAVNYAADFATAVNAELLLINVVGLPLSASEYAVTETLLEELEENTEKELSHLKEKLLERTGGKLAVDTFSEIGSIGYTLEEISKRKKPLAVVMSVKNSTALERFLVGSNTLAAVHHITQPVLIVPEKASYTKVKKVAVACDFDEDLSMDTIKTIKSWLSLLNAEPHIINVTKNPEISSHTMSEAIGLQNQLTDFTPRFHYLTGEKVEKGIASFVEKYDPDLLIVVPRDKGLFHKSHTKALILHSTIPVLSIGEHL